MAIWTNLFTSFLKTHQSRVATMINYTSRMVVIWIACSQSLALINKNQYVLSSREEEFLSKI